MSNEILYLKIDRNVRAESDHILLKEIAAIQCSSPSVKNRVNLIRIPAKQIKGPGRYVFSVLDIIAAIQLEFPNLQINNLGESDFIITVEKERKMDEVFSWIKTAFVCLLAFFGAAFSIMAFNNDAGIAQLFRQLYERITGNPSDGFTMLEISYSIGVGLGILVFFHHFSRKKKVSDPTPMEVEMRTYEDDVDAALIESGARKGNS